MSKCLHEQRERVEYSEVLPKFNTIFACFMLLSMLIKCSKRNEKKQVRKKKASNRQNRSLLSSETFTLNKID